MNALRSNLLAICLGASLSVSAGAVIQLGDDVGGTHTGFFDSQKTKIEGDDKTSSLIDLEKRPFLGVTPSAQPVTGMSETYQPATDGKNGENVGTAKMENLRAGPTAAGFATLPYRASLRDTVCSDQPLPGQASTLTDIATFFSTVVALSNTALDESVQAKLSKSVASVCDSAANPLNKDLQTKQGTPPKAVSVDEATPEFAQIHGQGNIESKVFKAPAAFALTTMQEMEKALDDAMSEIRGVPTTAHPG